MDLVHPPPILPHDDDYFNGEDEVNYIMVVLIVVLGSIGRTVCILMLVNIWRRTRSIHKPRSNEHRAEADITLKTPYNNNWANADYGNLLREGVSRL